MDKSRYEVLSSLLDKEIENARNRSLSITDTRNAFLTNIHNTKINTPQNSLFDQSNSFYVSRINPNQSSNNNSSQFSLNDLNGNYPSFQSSTPLGMYSSAKKSRPQSKQQLQSSFDQGTQPSKPCRASQPSPEEVGYTVSTEGNFQREFENLQAKILILEQKMKENEKINIQNGVLVTSPHFSKGGLVQNNQDNEQSPRFSSNEFTRKYSNVNSQRNIGNLHQEKEQCQHIQNQQKNGVEQELEREEEEEEEEEIEEENMKTKNLDENQKLRSIRNYLNKEQPKKQSQIHEGDSSDRINKKENISSYSNQQIIGQTSKERQISITKNQKKDVSSKKSRKKPVPHQQSSQNTSYILVNKELDLEKENFYSGETKSLQKEMEIWQNRKDKLNQQYMNALEANERSLSKLNSIKKQANKLIKTKKMQEEHAEEYDRLFSNFERSEVIRQQQKLLINSLKDELNALKDDVKDKSFKVERKGNREVIKSVGKYHSNKV